MNNRVAVLLVLLGSAVAAYFYSRTRSGQDLLASATDAIAGVFVNRGIRNCNPGNIRRTSTHWNNSFATQAECEAAGRTWDPDFVVFYTMADGVRAMGHLIGNYESLYGIETINGIVYRYAPPSDGNDTDGYAARVASYVGVSPDTVIDVRALLPQIVSGMMIEETGYTDDVNNITAEVYAA
jgi:hypothetical protein